MKTPKLNAVVSIAFTGHRLYATLLKQSGSKLQATRATQVAMALDPLNNDPQLVGAELRRRLDEAGIGEKRCIVCLPLQWAFILPVDVPDIPEADRESFLALQAEKGFPFSIDDLVQSSTWPTDRRATMVAMPRNYLTALQAAIAAAGLKIVSITLSVASLGDTSPKAGRREGIDLLVGAEGLEMAVRAGGGFAALRLLDNASEHELDAAHFDGEAIVRQMRITLGQLPAELLSGVKTISVYGPESLTKPLAEQIAPLIAKLGLQMEPARGVNVGGGSAARDAAPQTIGAAARLLRGVAAPVELLPRLVTQWERIAKRVASGRSVVFGSLGAILLLAGGGAFGWQYKQLSDLNGQWAVREPVYKKVNEIRKQIGQFQAWFTDQPRTLDILEALTTVFPTQGQIWVRTIKIDNEGVVECQVSTMSNEEAGKVREGLSKVKMIASPDITNVRTPTKPGEPTQLTIRFQWKAQSNGS